MASSFREPDTAQHRKNFRQGGKAELITFDKSICLNHYVFNMYNKILNAFKNNPIIPAVKDEKALEEALETDNGIIFIITSTIFSVAAMVERCKAADKIVFVHFDLVEGLARSVYALDYLIELTKPDGIITTKTNFVKSAREKNIFVIQRFFIFDSISVELSFKVIKECKPDAIEILPGVMPKVIKKFSESTSMPIIAGGLITDREDIMTALNAGACSISSTQSGTWYM